MGLKVFFNLVFLDSKHIFIFQLPPRVEHSRMSSIVSLTGMSRDCRALQCKIQEIRENNSVVARTINELHQEVSDALEERIALEYQLEQLKSFGDE